MISFKQFCILTEEWKLIAKTDKKGMWKNPTRHEYKDIPPGVRAVVDHLGNVYISDTKIRYDQDSGFSDNHAELMNQMKKAWPKMSNFKIGAYSSDYTKALSLVRVGKTSLFKIGGDEWEQVLYQVDENGVHEDLSDPIHKKRMQLLRKANKKNPAFSFKYLSISDEDDRWTM